MPPSPTFSSVDILSPSESSEAAGTMPFVLPSTIDPLPPYPSLRPHGTRFAVTSRRRLPTKASLFAHSLLLPLPHFPVLLRFTVWFRVLRVFVALLLGVALSALFGGQNNFVIAVTILVALAQTHSAFFPTLNAIQADAIAAVISFPLVFLYFSVMHTPEELGIPLALASNLAILSALGMPHASVAAALSSLTVATADDAHRFRAMLDRLYGVFIGLASVLIVSLVNLPSLHLRDVLSRLKLLTLHTFRFVPLILREGPLEGPVVGFRAAYSSTGILLTHIDTVLSESDVFHSPVVHDRLLDARIRAAHLHLLCASAVEVAFVSTYVFGSPEECEAATGLPIRRLANDVERRAAAPLLLPRAGDSVASDIIIRHMSLAQHHLSRLAKGPLKVGPGERRKIRTRFAAHPGPKVRESLGGIPVGD